MEPDVSPLKTGRRLLRYQAGRWWWVPLIAAGIWFVIAWLVMRANYTSLATVGVLVGVVFLIAAVNEAALAGVMGGGWAVWYGFLSVLLVLGGIWALVRPVDTFFAFASVLGLLLLLQGVFTIVRGVAMRDVSPYWWLDLVCGVLLTLLGIWVDTSDRVWTLGARAAFILLWVGFMAIFRGISDIAFAFSLRHLARGEDDRQYAEPRAGTPPAMGRRRSASDVAASEVAPGASLN